MPKVKKVKLNTITVTAASIQKEINEIEALLEGRMDNDNFISSGAESASLGKSSFADFADFGTPIYSDKFFGTDAQITGRRNQPDFLNDVFVNLLNKSHDSDTYAIMTQKGTITLNYKNQINLEKPSVIVADTQMSLGDQQKAVDAYYEKKKQAQLEWEIKNSQPNTSFGEVLFGAIFGGAAGVILGILGGPFGMIVGAGAGLALGASLAGIASTYGFKNGPFDFSYEAHKTNSQLVLFRHPPNYRMVSTLEVIDRMNGLFKEQGVTSSDVRYFYDFDNLTRYEEAKYPAMAVRISTESNVNKETGYYQTFIGAPFSINAELTGVWFSVVPHYPSTELIESEDEYITALCEIDILFKEIT